MPLLNAIAHRALRGPASRRLAVARTGIEARSVPALLARCRSRGVATLHRLPGRPPGSCDHRRMTADFAWRVEPLTPNRRDAFLDFFDHERGRAFADNPAWSGCYCHFFVAAPALDFDALDANANRTAMRARIETGEMEGYLAFDDAGRVASHSKERTVGRECQSGLLGMGFVERKALFARAAIPDGDLILASRGQQAARRLERHRPATPRPDVELRNRLGRRQRANDQRRRRARLQRGDV